ncbi:Ig-like domain-containing protein [Colwellia sp. MSW7]|uniref:Ig-like domain-containing protein n=1 Tax=Colwellia maritima TaxID=2912588 RepID=A0ABS9X626_9GAMM|nr:Ig-like domain-containing protein [Colwellia maritima]MCI2285222.1 Ig-like domain-containing protein [Colwellia maritima]
MLFGFYLRKIFIALSFIIVFFSSFSKADVDIRVSDVRALSNGVDVDYVASISSCGDLTQIQAGTSTKLINYTHDDIVYNPTRPSQCYLHFSLSGAGRFSPVLSLTYQGSDAESYSESFSYEDISPELSFNSASIIGEANEQRLIIEVEATDNQDITYISFDVVGLSAAVLRNSGGVVAEAKESSFASTTVAQRVYPISDTQTTFQLSIPLNQSLSMDQIAFDTLILSDITVVDASGNHDSISKVAFTGDSIQETANALVVSNTQIVISNALQTPVIIPAIEFQFRGVVSLPGAGNGISYASSHPDLVDVTSAGVIYALKETAGQQVSITVSYAGLESVIIPVEVDFSKEMVGITLEGVDVNNPLTLPSLNTYYALPEMVGVFDDGSTTSLSGHWTPLISLNPSMSAFLEKNTHQQIKSSVIITEGSDYGLRLSLQELPGVFADIRVKAIDKAPSIELDVPSNIFSDNDLLISAVVNDDVGINQVQFFLDDASIGTVLKPPYELMLPLSSQLEGRVLKLTSKVTDTAGQQTLSIDYEVTVNAPTEATIPAYSFVKPFDGQRIVESSPMKIQIESSLGILPDAARASGIKRVEFFFDGKKIGEARFPGIEVRDVEGSEDQEMFETWSMSGNVPSISTNESSIAVGAIIYTHSGQELAPKKIIRVVENIAPIVNIVTPVTGGIVTVGQKLPIKIEVIDDSLMLGASIEILLEDKVIASRSYYNDSPDVESLTTQSAFQNFSYEVLAEDVGSTLKLQAKVTDFHQETSLSSIVRIPVKSDQSPTIAISNPSVGSSFVSGLPIQLRADAVDDIKISRVDFYVNSQLVGSDHIPPYAYNYETQKELLVEQKLTIHAIAYDSSEQEAVSNSVDVTLGQDEESPVVNISSPFISASDVGDDIAGVIAQSEFVFKVTGFDNVGAERAEVKGIKSEGNGFVLTGNTEDIITGDDFPIQKIPGVLNAYSALKLTKTPEYINKTSAEYDKYPVSVTVFDETGNSSTASIIIGVYPDKPPTVTDVTTNNSLYFIKDTVDIQVLSNDDRAVTRVETSYKLNGDILASHIFSKESGLVPMPILQVNDKLNLSELPLLNEKQTIIVQVVAFDQLGQESGIFESEIKVTGDIEGPLAKITNPVPGSILYAEDNVTFSVRASDGSGLQKIKIMNGDLEVSVFDFSEQPKEANEVFNYNIPQDVDSLVLTIISTDVLGNSSTLNQSYTIATDIKPNISIRHPAAGSRLVEGESFTINALVSDNRSIQSVEIFIEENGISTFSKRFSTYESEHIVNEGAYFSANLRVPHKSAPGMLKIGVRAQDSVGLVTEKLLDLEIMDDQKNLILIYLIQLMT